jgi:hypothetical protein
MTAMARIDPGFLDYQRRHAMRPDARRHLRPGFERHLPRSRDGDLLRRLYGFKSATRLAVPDYACGDVQDIGAAEAQDAKANAQFRAEVAALRLEWELFRFRHLPRKAFNPDQPRVPAGNPDGGQWTSEGAQGAPMRVAGPVPRIPQRRPPTSAERTAVYKQLAAWLLEKGMMAGEVIAKTSWLYPVIPLINSYMDSPKSMAELQQAALQPTRYDYQDHHVVGQIAEQDGYPRSRIDAPDNIVRIPTMKHWEINGWYQRPNKLFGGMTPRDYLRNKDWETRRQVGIEALKMFGVLKP